MLTWKCGSYNKQLFGPRGKGIEKLEVELPQSFSERKELSFIAVEDFVNSINAYSV